MTDVPLPDSTPSPSASSTPSVPASSNRPWTILGRLTKAVREQNWFAVALELVIVVIGVFIGIQLGNWNAERQQRALGTEYLQRIADDIRGDAETLDTA